MSVPGIEYRTEEEEDPMTELEALRAMLKTAELAVRGRGLTKEEAREVEKVMRRVAELERKAGVK